MKEIRSILKKISELRSADESSVLATVVDVRGSSYRLPGAKMLILENGETFGTVSGGCLEADVLERAKKVLASGLPEVFVYDTTNDLDSVFSLNMGCRGVIRILLEPVKENNLLSFISRCRDEKRNGLAATLIAEESGLTVGGRILFDEDSTFHSDFNSKITDEIAAQAADIFASGKPLTHEFDFGEVFFDLLPLPVNLTIFGAGADAVPLAGIAKELGWHVTVVDHREAFANKTRFSGIEEILISHPEQTSQNIRLDKDSVAVIMTHNYEHDKNILRALLGSDAAYIGKLGPKRRSENMLRELKEEGLEFSENDLQKFHSPVGLDIGADTPEAIALSIVAEIQTVLKGRLGGFLRERKGSIYGRDE